MPEASQFLQELQKSANLPKSKSNNESDNVVLQSHLYTRACSKVEGFFSRTGQRLADNPKTSISVARKHVQHKLSEFVAMVQSKGYSVSIEDDVIVVSAE